MKEAVYKSVNQTGNLNCTDASGNTNRVHDSRQHTAATDAEQIQGQYSTDRLEFLSKNELGDSLDMKSLLYQEPSPSPSYLEPLPLRMERGDLTGVHTQLQSQSQDVASETDRPLTRDTPIFTSSLCHRNTTLL
ncbi:UNVERIFIED_CONTAM: hypothetical protein FKN15_063098 [Acipenser sinensis]